MPRFRSVITIEATMPTQLLAELAASAAMEMTKLAANQNHELLAKYRALEKEIGLTISVGKVERIGE